jgi:glycosyltransferase involved in cell wall biosynthesis
VAALRNIKVVHLTSVHPPYDVRILHKECKTLMGAGYEVALICPHERDEIYNGVRVRAVHKTKNRWRRMTRTVWQVYRAALAENASAYHFHDSELILVSLLLRFRGKRVIYDVHEDLPRQILTKDWISPSLRTWVAKVAEFVEGLSGRCFDGIVAATPTIARRFPLPRTVTVQNFPILSEIISSGSVPYCQRPPVIAYAGGITVFQGIKEIIESMALLPDALAAKLKLAGTFESPELEHEVRQMTGWGKVVYLGQQQREDVVRLLHGARIGIVVDHPIPNYLESYSTKLFEYMASGIPVVASDFPLWRQIIGGADCGLLVDPLNPKAIAEAIQWLFIHSKEAANMGKRGQQTALARYSWTNEAAKLLGLYSKVIQ